jgi:hypothetical protein
LDKVKHQEILACYGKTPKQGGTAKMVKTRVLAV